MGHGMCGGCHAALHRTMDGAGPGRGGIIADWIAVLEDASAQVRAEFPTFANREAVRAGELSGDTASIANPRIFPVIPELEQHRSLKSRGPLFRIHTGLEQRS